jgi:hypothetical protein
MDLKDTVKEVWQVKHSRFSDGYELKHFDIEE